METFNRAATDSCRFSFYCLQMVSKLFISQCLSYLVTFICFVVSFIAGIWASLMISREIPSDDDGYYYFSNIRTFSIVVCVLLFFEAAACVVLFFGICLKSCELILPWLLYHGLMTFVFSFTPAVEERSEKVTLYSILAILASLTFLCAPVYWHFLLLLESQQNGYERLPDTQMHHQGTQFEEPNEEELASNQGRTSQEPRVEEIVQFTSYQDAASAALSTRLELFPIDLTER